MPLAHAREELLHRRIGDARQRLLELADRPLEAAHEEGNALARAFDCDRLAVELAGGVAVVASTPLQLLADQRAIVRLVVVHLAQRLPLGPVARPVIHEDDERSRARALGFQHAVKEIYELGVRHLMSPRSLSAASFPLSRNCSIAAGARLMAMRLSSRHTSSVSSAAVAPPFFLPRSRSWTVPRSTVTAPP